MCHLVHASQACTLPLLLRRVKRIPNNWNVHSSEVTEIWMKLSPTNSVKTTTDLKLLYLSLVERLRCLNRYGSGNRWVPMTLHPVAQYHPLTEGNGPYSKTSSWLSFSEVHLYLCSPSPDTVHELTCNMGSCFDPLTKQYRLCTSGDCHYGVCSLDCLLSWFAYYHWTTDRAAKTLCSLSWTTPHTHLCNRQKSYIGLHPMKY